MALSAVGSQRETTALPHTYQLLTSFGIPAEVDQSGGGSAERSELRREVGEGPQRWGGSRMTLNKDSFRSQRVKAIHLVGPVSF